MTNSSSTGTTTSTTIAGSKTTSPSALVGMTSNAEDCRDVYNSWATNYEKDVKEWGYDAPTKVADLLAKHCPSPNTMLDAGCGDGLSGLALRQYFPSQKIIGADLSREMLQIAQSRGCYTSIQQVDLNQIPFPFEDNQFDAIACVGTMTYLDPTSLEEFCRIVKPGGYICYTNRTDKLQNFEKEEIRLQNDGYWKLIEKQGPVPYLPNHADFADKIQVMIYLFQRIK